MVKSAKRNKHGASVWKIGVSDEQQIEQNERWRKHGEEYLCPPLNPLGFTIWLAVLPKQRGEVHRTHDGDGISPLHGDAYSLPEE